MKRNTQIPKVIHYCWFSGESKPVVMQECIKSWHRMMPDYTIKCWDASTLDFNIPFLREAYECRNWAFVTDYMRFHILYEEGGIYLDSDVEVYKSFDTFLQHSFFSGIEYEESRFFANNLSALLDEAGNLFHPHTGDRSFGLSIEAAIIGAVKGHPYVKACLTYYQNSSYKDAQGTIFRRECPVVMATTAERWGFVYKNVQQELSDGICFYPYPVFVYGEGFEVPNAYARHWRNGSWRDKTEMSRIYRWLKHCHLQQLYCIMERSPFLFRIYRKISSAVNPR